MKERYEFRVFKSLAERYFDTSEGKDFGSVICFLTSPGERLFERIQEASKTEDLRGNSLFAGWRIVRKYTDKELKNAELFRFFFNGKGKLNETDTSHSYNTETACEYCGSGAIQNKPLEISLSKHTGVDLVSLLSGELLLSPRVTEIFKASKITGVSFHEISKITKKTPIGSLYWKQLKINNTTALLSKSSKFGDYPFKEVNEKYYRCGLDHILGLNVLSEIYISAKSWSGYDVGESSQFVGVKRGLFRPTRIFLCSPKFRETVLKHEIKGLKFEVAYFEQ